MHETQIRKNKNVNIISKMKELGPSNEGEQPDIAQNLSNMMKANLSLKKQDDPKMMSR